MLRRLLKMLEQGDEVTHYYKDIFVECGYDDCDYQQKIESVLTTTKVEW